MIRKHKNPGWDYGFPVDVALVHSKTVRLFSLRQQVWEEEAREIFVKPLDWGLNMEATTVFELLV